MVNQVCERTGIRCRFHMVDLPREIEVSSQIRHNISMAVKEAVHNVIRHAEATEVTVAMLFDGGLLTITILDNGCGFQPAGTFSGNGLPNMRRRLSDIGGSCVMESRPGAGTTIRISLSLRPSAKTK
jgi:signal transduction histidine kinase